MIHTITCIQFFLLRSPDLTAAEIIGFVDFCMAIVRKERLQIRPQQNQSSLVRFGAGKESACNFPIDTRQCNLFVALEASQPIKSVDCLILCFRVEN